jgi:hypothetical protein
MPIETQTTKPAGGTRPATHTITAAWLGDTTILDERDGWEPGDRSPQYQSTPGYRCPCGNIYRIGQRVSVTRGTLGGAPHFWATCDNCGNFMF